MRTQISIAIMVGFIFLLGIYGAQAEDTVPKTAHTWTTEQGTLSFVDDPKKIPERYKEEAKQVELQSLRDYSRFTAMGVSSKQFRETVRQSIARYRNLNRDSQPQRDFQSQCTGTLTIDRERRIHTENGQRLNSLFFIVRNSCGEEVSVTREQPLLIVRSN